jgi:hypothetical protein
MFRRNVSGIGFGNLRYVMGQIVNDSHGRTVSGDAVPAIEKEFLTETLLGERPASSLLRSFKTEPPSLMQVNG